STHYCSFSRTTEKLVRFLLFNEFSNPLDNCCSSLICDQWALIERPELLLKLLPPILLFFLINFLVAQKLGQYLQLPYAAGVCLIFTTLARNSPLSLAIAASAFPDHPLITLTLVIGPLIELPILILISQRLRLLRKT
ncbi:MAG: hypothetical protein ACFCU7_01205, partial [Pleurocapsa sp.]